MSDFNNPFPTKKEPQPCRNHCGQKIYLKKDVVGKWLALNADDDLKHSCSPIEETPEKPTPKEERVEVSPSLNPLPHTETQVLISRSKNNKTGEHWTKVEYAFNYSGDKLDNVTSQTIRFIDRILEEET